MKDIKKKLITNYREEGSGNLAPVKDDILELGQDTDIEDLFSELIDELDHSRSKARAAKDYANLCKIFEIQPSDEYLEEVREIGDEEVDELYRELSEDY